MTALRITQPSQQLTDLSPRLQPVRISPSSRAPKRDHDEWLVRGMVGWFGSRAGSGLKYLGMGQFAGQAAAKRMGRPMWGAPGGKAAHIRGRERWAMPGRPGCQAAHAFRDAARDAPEPGYHKPKTPIGRRGESLILFADYPRRGNRLAGPASLPINPRRQRRRGRCHALAMPEKEPLSSRTQSP